MISICNDKMERLVTLEIKIQIIIFAWTKDLF